MKYAEDFKLKNLLTFFRSSNKTFDEIHKALDEFLEKKRENFKRFYFLSNDELLEILSKVVYPAQIIPYLRKIFDNIENLEIDQKDNVLSMISQEGEHSRLRYCNFRGEEIEEWLKSLEDSMK